MIARATPKILVFLEERLELVDGRYFTPNPGSAGEGWRENLPPDARGVLVARARDVVSPAGRAIDGEVRPLPYYVGVRQTLASLRATRRVIRKVMTDADAVIVKTPGAIGMLVCLEARRRGVPLAVQVVGDAGGVLQSGIAGRVLRVGGAVADALTARVVRSADIVRYVPAEKLRRRYPPAPSARVHIFSDVTIAAQAQWEFDANSPWIVNVGSADQTYKGQHLLIRALPEIRKRIPGTRLRIIGGGRLLPELQRLAADVGVAEYVEFAGYVSDKAEMHRLVGEGTLFVLPSLTEGMPRALVEAMALGVPAIGSRVGGVPDVLPREATFEAGDAAEMTRLIIAFMTDEEALRARSRAGLETVRPFNRESRSAAIAAWRKDLSELVTPSSAGGNDDLAREVDQ